MSAVPTLHPPSQGRLTPKDRWRQLLTVVRLARDVACYIGERKAALQVAYALSGANASLLRDSFTVIASQAARSVPMPRIADIEDALVVIWCQPAAATHRKRRRPAEVAREALPVEAARTVPILTLLARYGVECRPAGAELLGRCPFRDHRHRHLYVNPRKGFWKCWPCGLGGDGITFVMRLKGLDFTAAVREVAA